ncbi:MAG: hypothetical protein HeimC3_30150 [Candidatus Heimdallarchaeota archaeon LC_3]|nr:MAG: hypothetical protein HeimC3_30150 [Candidatus Heimdallarchaeota archaeon LC_3]
MIILEIILGMIIYLFFIESIDFTDAAGIFFKLGIAMNISGFILAFFLPKNSWEFYLFLNLSTRNTQELLDKIEV